MAVCHSFVYFSYFITCIQSSNHIHTIHSPRPLSISSSLVSSVGQTSLWCQAKNRTWACLPASWLATNWASHTMLSHAAPYWAMPHHTEPCRTILSHAAPYWATPHHDVCDDSPQYEYSIQESLCHCPGRRYRPSITVYKSSRPGHSPVS